jgi:hypothetical protein
MTMRHFHTRFKHGDTELIMPRTRRTPASQTPAAEDAASVEMPMVAADAPSSENAVTPEAADLNSSSPTVGETPAKTPRRRVPRQPKTAEPETPVAPELKAPVAEEAPAPRRRGRRTAAPEPAIAPTVSPILSEAPDLKAPIAEETPPAAPRRRRGRQTGASETPQAEAPLQAAETPVAVPRRRGRRTSAEMPSAAATPSPTPAVVPSRRRGQARSTPAPVAEIIAVPSPDAAEVSSEISVEVAEGPPLEEAAPSRRRGRRRGAGTVPDTPPAPLSLELPDFEAPVDPSVSGEEPEDADKRGRRSRRSRRRRGGNDEPTTEMLEAAGSTLLLPEEILEVETPEEDEDDTLLAYPPPAPPTYIAPRIVPPVLPPADETQGPRLTSAVNHVGKGLPHITVNGTGHAPYFFFVNAETAPDGETVEAQIRQAAANGIHLFSGVMYLPLRNAYGDRSFGAIDALVQQILTADPEGYVLPRLQFFPTNYWARTHEDQMARYPGGEEGDVSLASTEFWADCVDALDALIAHFADPSTPGGDRVLGFHLDRGEWFTDASAGYDLSLPNQIAFQNWLHAKYQALHALRAAWHDADLTWEDAAVPDWPGQTASVKKTDTQIYSTRREGRWPDYAQYASDLAAGIIAGLAEAVKTFSLGRMIVAASYGYTLEFAGRNDSGHLALGKLLASPHLDIVAGPNSYAGRGAGSPAAFGAPLDSVALHGKLWLVEDDTKTFLAEAETEDTYNPKIVSGADTQAIHQRHFGAALAHRAGVTWMDLWGQGWLNSPDIWRELGGLAMQAGRWEKLVPNTPVTPDVAVLVDEASLCYLKNDANGLGTHLVSRTRDLLLRTGGSVGFYLQSDITRPNFPDAKLYLFLNALRITTEERQTIREKLQRPGKTLAWVFAPGFFDENGPSSEEVNEVVGMALRPQPWNSRGGSVATEIKHPITERIRGTKKIGQEEILNPLYAVSDPQAIVVAEYVATGATSLATREHKGGWKSVFFGDPYLTTELLRGLYAYAGVALYDGQDDIVYAGGDGALTIHGLFTGQRTLTLPRKASVYDVFDNKIIATNTRSFRAFVRARTTRLFLWGDGRALALATGLDLPAQSAEVVEDAAPTAQPPLVSPPPRSSRETRAEQDANEALAASNPIPNPVPSRELQTVRETLAVTLPDETDDEGAEGLEGSESAADDTDPNAPTRRSRWQRRRAAARARRDAERLAKQAAGDSTGGAEAVSDAPVDMAILLPGLPPRRAAASLPADRIADILAADTAEDNTQDIPDTVALTLSDIALTDMADDYGDAETEFEGEE